MLKIAEYVLFFDRHGEVHLSHYLNLPWGALFSYEILSHEIAPEIVIKIQMCRDKKSLKRLSQVVLLQETIFRDNITAKASKP